MRRTMEFIGRKQLKKLTKANWKSFTQSKVSIMERDIDFKWVNIKNNLIKRQANWLTNQINVDVLQSLQDPQMHLLERF